MQAYTIKIADIEFTVNLKGLVRPILPYMMKPFLDNSANPCFSIDIDTDYHPHKAIQYCGCFGIPGTPYATCHNTEEKKCQIQLYERDYDKNLMIADLDDSNSRHKVQIVPVDGLQTFQIRCAVFAPFSYSAINYDAFPIHASAVIHNGKAYIFLGKGGRGKSTHARLWIENIPNTELLNDDIPIIRYVEGEFRIYGSPWSGKTNCYRQLSAPLGGIVMLNRGKNDVIRRASTLRAMAILYPCVMGGYTYDKNYMMKFNTILKHIVEEVPVYDLWCTATKNAAVVCHSEIAKK